MTNFLHFRLFPFVTVPNAQAHPAYQDPLVLVIPSTTSPATYPLSGLNNNIKVSQVPATQFPLLLEMSTLHCGDCRLPVDPRPNLTI